MARQPEPSHIRCSELRTQQLRENRNFSTTDGSCKQPALFWSHSECQEHFLKSLHISCHQISVSLMATASFKIILVAGMKDTVFQPVQRTEQKPDLHCAVRRGGANVHARLKRHVEGWSRQDDSQAQRSSVFLCTRMVAIELPPG